MMSPNPAWRRVGSYAQSIIRQETTGKVSAMPEPERDGTPLSPHRKLGQVWIPLTVVEQLPCTNGTFDRQCPKRIDFRVR